MKNRSTSILVIVLMAMGLGCRTQEPLPSRVIWFDKPAEYFEEAFPLGNGRIGAMVFGTFPSERILLNEESLWAGGPVDPYMNPEAHRFLPQVREALFAGDYPLADKLIRNMQGSFSQSYAPLGDLYIDLKHDKEIEDYTRTLDLRKAVALTQYRKGSVTYQREVFISFPDQLLFIRLSADVPQELSFVIRTDSQLRFSVRTTGENDLIMSGRAPKHAEPNYRRDIPNPLVYDEANHKGMRFEVRVRILDTDGSFERTDTTVSIQNAGHALIAVALATSFNGFDKEPGTEGKNPKALVQNHLNNTEGRLYQDIKLVHSQDFQSYFNRITLSLGESSHNDLPIDERLRLYRETGKDTDLEALYFQFGRYLLISSSRPGGIPANLQGIWNPHLRPPWSSNYTTNINVEMNYWPAEVTNLSDMHKPLLRFISDLAVTGKVTAKTFFNCRGWCCNHNTDIWAMTNPVGDFGQGHPVWASWPLAGAWFSLHLWEHFAFNQDKAWLKTYAYPLMKGAAQFCLDWLVEGPEGFLVTAPATSPENLYRNPDGYRGAISIGTTSDLALIRGLFQKIILSAELLSVDEEFVSEIRSALERLAPYRIGKKGNLQEWYYDWEDADPQHRHVSHLIGLYPDNQISLALTPELAAACRRSLELRGDGGTGWSKAWKINLWARLLDGNHAHKMLQTHLHYVDPSGETQYSGGGTYPNLFDAHPPFQIDGNFGGTAGIAEMLLQSHKGEIHLLPALPEVWSDGNISGLRARGGFTVDQEWQGGQLVMAQIHPDFDGEISVRYQGTVKKVKMEAGKTYHWRN